MISKRMREIYDKAALLYAKRNAAMREGVEERAALFMKMLGPSEAQPRVLDLGCGAGRDMAWLEGHGARVVGADLSAGMLAIAKGEATGPLVQMDMRQLPFKNNCFNGVWCMASMLHIPRAEASGVLAEVRRVLLPGGALLLGLQEGEGEQWEANPYGEGERFFARYSPQEAAELLTQAGFAVQSVYSSVTSPRQWVHLLATGPMLGQDGS